MIWLWRLFVAAVVALAIWLLEFETDPDVPPDDAPPCPYDY